VKGLVCSAWDAFRGQDVRLAVPALLAYAHYLEDELRLEEALDVLETLLRLGGERLRPSDAIAADLRIGRVNRKLNRFDEGEAAYLAAAGLAEAAGDVHSALLSRVGRAISTQTRGNLAEAERLLRELAEDARAADDADIQARAQHALGTTLLFRGQVGEGIVHVWQAVELYDDEASRVRALGDLGTMLLAVGEAAGAERALLEVIRRGSAMQDVVSNAVVELMHCASYRRDRLGFERWRAECQARTQIMPPNILADFYLKAGIGHARFARFRLAADCVAKALRVAQSAGLHELSFRIERIRTGLRGCEAEVAAASEAAAEPVQYRDSGVREVAASLARLTT
jgi:tetratricopeptide (TPR) repeat protein